MDNRTALGLLARAALALDLSENPAAKAVLAGELAIRQQIFAAARAQIGLSPEDDSDEAREKIGDLLDHEAELLAGPTDTQAALLRLASAGSLPPDMYEIRVLPDFQDVPLEPEVDFDLMMATVRQPDKEQHFGPSSDLRAPSLVSLFMRHFRTRWPFKDFFLLVVGSRDGLILTVAQVWRIYPSLLDVSACTNLVEVLEKFAETYGAAIECEGKRGKFFLTVETPLQGKISYTADAGRKAKILISQVSQSVYGKRTSALTFGIDMIAYQAVLNRMRVKRSDIIDAGYPTVHPPGPAC